MTILAATTTGLLIAMLLVLARALAGPTAFDRILALNLFGTKTVLFIAVIGYLFERPEWLDLAIVYALVNFTGTLAVLRFTKYGSLARDLNAEPTAEAGPAPTKER